jgi:hypothetical protein
MLERCLKMLQNNIACFQELIVERLFELPDDLEGFTGELKLLVGPFMTVR